MPSGAVAARIMVKCRGELYQALKERLFGFRSRQPDFLPHFVCLEKLSGIAERDSALELAVMQLA